MMNCDEAFDALTDAVGRASAELEWHLEHCPRCRQMQEVLSPALELFDGDASSSAASSDDELSRDGGSPFLTPEVLRVAQRRAAELLAEQPRVEGRKSPPRMVVSWVAALATVVAVCVGAVALIPGSSETSARRSASEASLAGCTWLLPAEERVERETSRAVVLSCVSCHLGRME